MIEAIVEKFGIMENSKSASTFSCKLRIVTVVETGDAATAPTRKKLVGSRKKMLTSCNNLIGIVCLVWKTS